MSYRYISMKKFGGPEVLDLVTEKNLPEPGQGEVRIKVQATSINFSYLYQAVFNSMFRRHLLLCIQFVTEWIEAVGRLTCPLPSRDLAELAATYQSSIMANSGFYFPSTLRTFTA